MYEVLTFRTEAPAAPEVADLARPLNSFGVAPEMGAETFLPCDSPAMRGESINDSATGLRLTCSLSTSTTGAGAKWLIPFREIWFRRCCSDKPAGWSTASDVGAGVELSVLSSRCKSPRLCERSVSDTCSTLRSADGIRSGNEEAEPMLRCA